MNYNVSFVEYWVYMKKRGARERVLLDLLREEIALRYYLPPDKIHFSETTISELLLVTTVLDFQLLLRKLGLDLITNCFEIDKSVNASKIEESIVRQNQVNKQHIRKE